MKTVFYLLPLAAFILILSSCVSSNRYSYKSTFVETYVLSRDSVVEDSFQVEEAITADNKEDAFCQAYRNSYIFYIEESAHLKNDNDFRMEEVNLFNSRGKNITGSVKLSDKENRKRQIWESVYNSLSQLPGMKENPRIQNLTQPVQDN